MDYRHILYIYTYVCTTLKREKFAKYVDEIFAKYRINCHACTATKTACNCLKHNSLKTI